MPEPLKDYTGRCGGCKYYEGYTIRGKKVARGHCGSAPLTEYKHNNRHGNIYTARHSSMRQASTPKCKRYIPKEYIGEVGIIECKSSEEMHDIMAELACGAGIEIKELKSYKGRNGYFLEIKKGGQEQ